MKRTHAQTAASALGALVNLDRSFGRRGPWPFVLVNMATTADGKIATANRRVSSFTSSRDQANLLALRATAEAVMCGARTADLNRINLGPGPARYRRLRRRHGLEPYNLRVLVSGTGSIDPAAAIFRKRFSPILILVTRRASRARIARLRHLADAVCVCGMDEIDFRSALAWLYRSWGVRRLVCEGGGRVNDALFRAGLVNQLDLTIAPLIFGGRDAPTLADGRGAPRLKEATQLRLITRRRLGEELFLVFDVVSSGQQAKAARFGRPTGI